MASPPLVYTCIPLVVHLNIGFFLPAEGNCGPISVLLITVARVSLGMKPGCSARVFDPSPPVRHIVHVDYACPRPNQRPLT